MSTSQEGSQGDIWTQKCCPKAPKWAPKWCKNEYKTLFFFQSGQCVFYIVNTMLFFTLATPECNQKHWKTHPATQTVTLVSQLLKNISQVAPKYASMDPGGSPLSPFLWFCSAHFARSEKSLIFEHFGQGSAAESGSAWSFRLWESGNWSNTPSSPWRGCGES